MLGRKLAFNKKGSFLASLFIIQIFLSNNVNASALFDEQWRALLHIAGDVSLIHDAQFVSQSVHPEQIELNKAVHALSSPDEKVRGDYLCRFPARSLLIKKYYKKLIIPNLTDACSGLRNFTEQVPGDDVYLIYAYENIAQPASMMGHVFLKLEGGNAQGMNVEHAVSFYTDTLTFNFPKLLFDSLVVGKKGYFMVSPYQQLLGEYNYIEQRNVIEYPLKISKFSKRLIQYHIWELKNVKFTYFFNRYNCATLTNDFISIASPANLSSSLKWLSPLDVIKESSKNNLLGNPILQPSDNWKIRMLQDALDRQGVDWKKLISNSNPSKKLNKRQRFLLYNLELSNFQLNHLAEKNSQKNIANLLRSKWGIDNDSLYIETDTYKNPIDRPNDSQINVALSNNARMSFEYIPTSHQISDDNRASFSESELKLLSFKGSVSLVSAVSHIDDITLYKMASLIPYSSLTGGWSKNFSLGAAQLYDSKMNQHLTTYTSGGVGGTYRLSDDFIAFSMINVGATVRSGDVSLYYEPEIGLFFYEVFSLKTTLSYSEKYIQGGSGYLIKQLAVDQTWFANKDYSFVLHYKKDWIKKNYHENLGIEFRRYF